jgi:cytochrome c oxidase subunit 1
LARSFGVFAGFYYWFPKMTGYLYSETLSKLHFLFLFLGVNLTFFPQHFLALRECRAATLIIPTLYATWNYVSSVGAEFTAP